MGQHVLEHSVLSLGQQNSRSPNVSQRHAYMVAAHADFQLLRILLKLLDHIDNDIYVHIDKQSRFDETDTLAASVNKAKLEIYSEVAVKWGGFSQVEAELFLLKKATQTDHIYYHFISGADLPLKSQTEIHNFFAGNAGKEFVAFQSYPPPKHTLSRVKYYHFLPEASVMPKNKVVRKLLRELFIVPQRLFRVDRWKDGCELQKGSNWFSITHNLALYILSQKDWIEKHFKHTYCSDEVFLQTLVMNSPYKNNLYITDYNSSDTGNMRYIDWKRGSPYTFRKEDYEALINSKYLFARKFSTKIDPVIIDMIANELSVR